MSSTENPQQTTTETAPVDESRRPRRAFVLLTVVTSLIVLGVVFVVRSDPTQRQYPAVVLVRSSGCKQAVTLSVGTVVEDSLIVTVAHSVAGQQEYKVLTVDGRSLPATLEAIDTDLDLALLHVAQLSIAPVDLTEAHAGSSVTFVAFADGEQVSRPAVIRRALRINTEDIYLNNKVVRPGLEVAAEVKVGNSGGPLIDDHSKMVGIIWGTSRNTQNRSWATRVEAIQELLKSGTRFAGIADLACAG